jgi:hypothetical protein
MSAVTFDTDLFPVQAAQEAPAALTAASTAATPGLFSRIVDALGRAYTVETPDGDIVFVYPF